MRLRDYFDNPIFIVGIVIGFLIFFISIPNIFSDDLLVSVGSLFLVVGSPIIIFISFKMIKINYEINKKLKNW